MPAIASDPTASTCLVVMGVSGSGKTTLGVALGSALGLDFVEGDTLHPPANIAKMAAGVPLDDADRAPFLAAVADVLRRAGDRGGVVLTCSALKRRYRDQLRAARPGTHFVLPVIDEDALRERLRRRSHHFMPTSLLASQMADFEPPVPAEGVVQVDGRLSLAAQVVEVVQALGVEDVGRGPGRAG